MFYSMMGTSYICIGGGNHCISLIIGSRVAVTHFLPHLLITLLCGQ